MTSEAFSAALLTMSTDTPKLHMPFASGGVTWIRATSSGSWPDSKQTRNVGKENRRVVAKPFLNDAADVLGDEETVDAEILRQFAVRVGRVAERQQMHDFRVGQLAGPLARVLAPVPSARRSRCR